MKRISFGSNQSRLFLTPNDAANGAIIRNKTSNVVRNNISEL